MLMVLCFTRQLLPVILRNPVCALDGLLPDTDLYPLLTHCRHLVGLILAEPGSDTSESDPWCDNRAHHDLTNWHNQLPTAKDLVYEVHRYLLERLLHDGVCLSDW